MRKTDAFTGLEFPKEKARFDASLRRERRSFDFAGKPNQGFMPWRHTLAYVRIDIDASASLIQMHAKWFK